MNITSDTIKLLICATIMAAMFMFFFVWLFILQRKKQNRYYMEREKLLFQAERRELKARVEEREIMMNQISKEVHDNIGQISTIIRMHFHEIERLVREGNISAEPQLLQYLKVGGKFIDDLIESAHNISHSLNSDYIKKRGLFRILSEQLEQIAHLKKIERELEITDDDVQIPPEQSLVIYRIAQEALNNIVKHSRATSIRVSLIHRGDFFKMIIVDNGIGLAEKDFEKGSTGISNMKQRACLLGGNIAFISSPGDGCRIELTINNLFYNHA